MFKIIKLGSTSIVHARVLGKACVKENSNDRISSAASMKEKGGAREGAWEERIIRGRGIDGWTHSHKHVTWLGSLERECEAVQGRGHHQRCIDIWREVRNMHERF